MVFLVAKTARAMTADHLQMVRGVRLERSSMEGRDWGRMDELRGLHARCLWECLRELGVEKGKGWGVEERRRARGLRGSAERLKGLRFGLGLGERRGEKRKWVMVAIDDGLEMRMRRAAARRRRRLRLVFFC